MSVQALQPSSCSRGTRGAWLCCICSRAASIHAALASLAMAAANSTPVPRGRVRSRTCPAWRGPFGQWLAAATLPFTLRLRARPAPSRASRVWPPTSSAPRGSSTERIPARVWARACCWIGAAASGRVTTAWALSTRAPLAQRSLQACRVVSRAFSQGSSTRAGKPSTLCSSSAPLSSWPSTAASSAFPPSPAWRRPASRVAGASLAAQPRQAIGSPPAWASLPAMAPACWKRAMKRRSMCCFQRHSSRLGPRARGPHRAMAAGASQRLRSASNCRARRWGRQARSRWGGSPAARQRARLAARVGAARTAHTPEGGRGAAPSTPQSPTAKIRGCPSTCRLAVVRTRPSPAQGRPAPASQVGARLPVQASSAGRSAATRRRTATPACRSRRSPRGRAAAGCRCSWSPRSSSSRVWSGWRPRRARASSTAAAPPPRMRRGWASSGRCWSQCRKGSSGFTPSRQPSRLRVVAPRSRLSQSQLRGGRSASSSWRSASSSPLISAITRVTSTAAHSRRRSMLHSSRVYTPATRPGSMPE